MILFAKWAKWVWSKIYDKNSFYFFLWLYKMQNTTLSIRNLPKWDFSITLVYGLWFNHMQESLERSFHASIMGNLLCNILWNASNFSIYGYFPNYPLVKVMQVKRWINNLDIINHWLNEHFPLCSSILKCKFKWNYTYACFKH